MDNLIDPIFVIAITLVTLIGAVVLFRGQRTTSNRLFFFVTICLAAWLFSNYQIGSAPPSDTLLWVRLSHLTAIPVLFSILSFSSSFPKPVGRSQLVAILSFPIALVVSVFSLSDKLVRSASLHEGVYTFDYGSFFYLYIAWVVVSTCLILGILLRQLSVNKNFERQQVKMLMTGFALSAVFALITDLLLPLIDEKGLANTGPIGTIFFSGFTAYAIATHQLFDIRIAVKRTIVYTVLLSFIFAIYSASIFFLTQIGQTGNVISRRSFVANLISAIIVGFSVDPLRRWLEDKTNHFLFKKEYEQQGVLNQLSKKLNDVVALDEALETVMQTVVSVLHLRHAVTYVFQQGENGQPAIKRVKQIGYSSTKHLYLDEDDFTIQFFTSNPGIVIVDTIEQELQKEQAKITALSARAGESLPKEVSQVIRDHAIKQAMLKKLRSLDAALAIPLHLNGTPIGLLLISEKLSGDTFSKEDLGLLETVGAQAISSIQKAKLYEGDQMKSEFVSIASHELLTPISAIEGYLSMILDEKMVQVEPKAREYLEKVYASSRRLSSLIKDLLSVSRIEAGRMKIEAQSLDIDKSILEAVDQLHFLAKDKGLAISYQSPSPALPRVWADPDRTMEILINLISNSIKYTMQGSITVTAETVVAPTAAVKVSVTDTGIGMTDEARSHLFEKFYRVPSTETVNIIGTGLGLYITKSLVERMGGAISVQSTPGQGSTFSFTLPLFTVEDSLPANSKPEVLRSEPQDISI